VVAPLTFDAAAADLIRRLKYSGDLSAGRLLALLLAAAIAERYVEQPAELIIPVPLHWRRLLRRGHNQAAVLARIVGRQLRIPVAYDAIRRVRATPPQTGLDRDARRRNLRGAFRLRQPLGCRSVALVDDVLTTGSTLDELIRTLRRAGVDEVQVWVVARTRAS
jgi:ComF family protein